MKKIIRLLLLTAALACATAHAQVQFAAPEHLLAAADVKLQFTHRIIKGHMAYLLNFDSEATGPFALSYADVLTLPDYIGVPGVLIGAEDLSKNITNFQTNFNALHDDKIKEYLPGVMTIIYEEAFNNQENIRNHQPLVIDPADEVKFNCATGGACDPIKALTGRGLYFDMVLRNTDHFGQAAINSYLAGHTLALRTAYNAKSDQDLKLAYAYDAYASHFLSDIFSAGHVRTPRAEMIESCNDYPLEVAGFLAKLMHDQEGERGLWFKDSKNVGAERWYGFGDDYLFISQNSRNLTLLKQALQKSADQIYAVFRHRLDINAGVEDMKTVLPNLSLINLHLSNLPAMFTVIDGRLNEYMDGKYELVDDCLQTAVELGYDLLTPDK